MDYGARRSAGTEGRDTLLQSQRPGRPPAASPEPPPKPCEEILSALLLLVVRHSLTLLPRVRRGYAGPPAKPHCINNMLPPPEGGLHMLGRGRAQEGV